MIPKQESIYQKPKNEFEPNFEDQVKQKKQRLWPGKVLPISKQDDSDDDDIFQVQKPQQINIDQVKNENDSDEEAARKRIQRRRQVIQSEIVNEANKVDDQQQDLTLKREIEVVDDEVLQRRRRAQQRTDGDDQEQMDVPEKKEKKKKDKQKQKQKKIKEEQEQIEEEQYEEEPPNLIELLKPVFISREEREKLDRKYVIEVSFNFFIKEEEIRMKEEKERNLERKKLETKLLIINSVRADSELKNEDDQDSDGNQVLPNDDDNETLDGHEYGLWKIRELKRLKKYREEKTKNEREKAEVERRRNLTDQQRIEEDFKLG